MTAPEPREDETEALAAYFHGRFTDTYRATLADTGCFHTKNYQRCGAAANALLASDWLAARDKQQRAAALRSAAAEYTVQAFVLHHHGVSFPDWLRDRADREQQP